jgi:hypothetical protein
MIEPRRAQEALDAQAPDTRRRGASRAAQPTHVTSSCQTGFGACRASPVAAGTDCAWHRPPVCGHADLGVALDRGLRGKADEPPAAPQQHRGRSVAPKMSVRWLCLLQRGQPRYAPRDCSSLQHSRPAGSDFLHMVRMSKRLPVVRDLNGAHSTAGVSTSYCAQGRFSSAALRAVYDRARS